MLTHELSSGPEKVSRTDPACLSVCLKPSEVCVSLRITALVYRVYILEVSEALITFTHFNPVDLQDNRPRTSVSVCFCVSVCLDWHRHIQDS